MRIAGFSLLTVNPLHCECQYVEESPSVAADATPLPAGSPEDCSVFAEDVIPSNSSLGISVTTPSVTVISNVIFSSFESVAVKVAVPAASAFTTPASLSTTATLSLLVSHVI